MRCIWQLRRYLYGHLNESDVRRLMRGTVPPLRLTGAIARFPLADDDAALQEMDAWLSTQAWLGGQAVCGVAKPGRPYLEVLGSTGRVCSLGSQGGALRVEGPQAPIRVGKVARHSRPEGKR